MWPFTTISPEVAVERELRARLLEKGVTREKLRSILETDQQVALRAVRTERAADSRERTVENTLRIKTSEERLDKAEVDLRGPLAVLAVKKAKHKAEITKAEAEEAKAEADAAEAAKVKAEAEARRAKAEADKAKAEAEVAVAKKAKEAADRRKAKAQGK
ncbi:MAG: hypothetical protein E3J36_00055 [Candidatus Nealsonbacteria bacterium]|nr:MAG: hypothetical protein E3J36_00055 [Candidatus Nealsonbacteria bacterium]